MIVELINWIIMIKYILLGIWGLLLLNSCENDDFVWGKEDFARIVGPEIWTRNTDSMTFTFSVYPEEVKEFAVASCVVIQGKVADYDRTVKLAVDPSKTTAQASDYLAPGSDTESRSGFGGVRYPALPDGSDANRRSTSSGEDRRLR